MSVSAVLARAMAIAAQQPAPQRLVKRLQQSEQKRVGKCCQQQEFLPWLPVPQTWTLERQFAFVFPPGELNLPATCVGKHDPPSILRAGDRLKGRADTRAGCPCAAQSPATTLAQDDRGDVRATPECWPAPTDGGDSPTLSALASPACRVRFSKPLAACPAHLLGDRGRFLTLKSS